MVLMNDGTDFNYFPLMIIVLVYRVKLKKMDDVRERLVGMGFDNLYQYRHGLDDLS